MSGRYRIGIDAGGTFTDLFLFDRTSGAMLRHKLLSTPGEPHLAPLQGLREILALAQGRGEDVEFVGLGTTVMTNALLERKGAPTGLIKSWHSREQSRLANSRESMAALSSGQGAFRHPGLDGSRFRPLRSHPCALGANLRVGQQRVERCAIVVHAARHHCAYRREICDVGSRIERHRAGCAVRRTHPERHQAGRSICRDHACQFIGLHRKVRVVRYDPHRKYDAALITDRMTAAIGEANRRRPQHRHRLNVVRRGKIKLWRHTGVARITPVGFPARQHPDFDTCTKNGAIGFTNRARADQANGRAGVAIPRRNIRRIGTQR